MDIRICPRCKREMTPYLEGKMNRRNWRCVCGCIYDAARREYRMTSPVRKETENGHNHT